MRPEKNSEKNEKNRQTRGYNSTARRLRAEETRRRIAEAAEKLIKAEGYEKATIADIAGLAGVATQTVYAVFGSKQGILTHLMQLSIADIDRNTDFSSIIRKTSITEMARAATLFTSARQKEHYLAVNSLGGIEALYPELAKLGHELHSRQRELIMRGVREGLAARALELTPRQEKILTDIFWVFTDAHIYHMLVIMSGWQEEHYEILLQRLLEMVMRDLAPEMLRDIGNISEGELTQS
ncbi:MAG: TetR/AcrR family transcriptional regulator [Deltaproteobacteria bacterium]|jgi:AcrR family transcriptional regulator|nr:TetR/AcrR family transcriptional regulator [Deltaproteobacteria bacterium]